MSEERQITDLAALAGKTIASVTTFGSDRNTPSRFGIVFTDGSFLRVAAYGTEDGDAWVNWCAEPYDEEKVDLGMMTQDELDRLKAERQRRIDEACLVVDRREYERLRAKFEGAKH